MTQGVSRRNPPLVGRFPGGNLAAVTSEGGKLGQGEAAPWPGDQEPTMGPGHMGTGVVMGGQVAPLPEGGGACRDRQLVRGPGYPSSWQRGGV